MTPSIYAGLLSLQVTLSVNANPFDLRRLEQESRHTMDQQGQALQQYALSQLRLVGTLGPPQQLRGLVITPQKQIHLVVAGELLGQNQAEVRKIDATGMTLLESRQGPEGHVITRTLRLELEKK
jgi:Tfp pilus assembly protein PilP